MDKKLAQRALNLRQGGIRAFFDKAKAYSNLINLGIGEPDFDTPRPIIDAATQAMLEGATHYTANAGDLYIRRQVADFLRGYHVEVDPETEIIMTCGGMGALSLFLLCVLEAGDEVLICDPQWLNYRAQVLFAGGTPVPVPVYEADDFVLQNQAIEKALTSRTKVLMINSPNNPTGAVYSEQDLRRIADLAIRHDLLVLSDEVYSEFLYDGMKHVSIASLEGMRERTVVVNSFSKAFAMTGWRLGYAAGPAPIIRRMILLQENLVACAPSPSQAAGAFALEHRSGVEAMHAIYEKRRSLILEGLNSIDGIHCALPRGAFYVFPSIRSFGLPSQDFAEKMLEEVQVAAIPGSAFGAGGEGYLRVSYANSEENLQEALERIRRFAGLLGN
ncbi:MAG: pyridoxal phosphate-dependent aminotransferase [Saccharofermentanales bacterium]